MIIRSALDFYLLEFIAAITQHVPELSIQSVRY